MATGIPAWGAPWSWLEQGEQAWVTAADLLEQAENGGRRRSGEAASMGDDWDGGSVGG